MCLGPCGLFAAATRSLCQSMMELSDNPASASGARIPHTQHIWPPAIDGSRIKRAHHLWPEVPSRMDQDFRRLSAVAQQNRVRARSRTTMTTCDHQDLNFDRLSRFCESKVQDEMEQCESGRVRQVRYACDSTDRFQSKPVGMSADQLTTTRFTSHIAVAVQSSVRYCLRPSDAESRAHLQCCRKQCWVEPVINACLRTRLESAVSWEQRPCMVVLRDDPSALRRSSLL
nr:hypothetical protein CFP56_24294 [Quercus suber]